MLFVDLGSIGDAGLVATTLATMLGLSVQAQDAQQSLVSHLRERRMLLIFWTRASISSKRVAMLTSRIFDEMPASAHPCDEPRSAARGRRARLQAVAAALPSPMIRR